MISDDSMVATRTSSKKDASQNRWASMQRTDT